MTRARTRIDRHGRVVIPAPMREELGLCTGDVVIMRVEDGELRLSTLAEAIRRAQEAVAQYIEPGRSLVDELIAERRAEAERD